jgi:hypothetical protein
VRTLVRWKTCQVFFFSELQAAARLWAVPEALTGVRYPALED